MRRPVLWVIALTLAVIAGWAATRHDGSLREAGASAIGSDAQNPRLADVSGKPATAPAVRVPTVAASASGTNAVRGQDTDAAQLLQRALAVLPCSPARMARWSSGVSVREGVVRQIDDALQSPQLAESKRVELRAMREEVAGQNREDSEALAACQAIPESERRAGITLLQRAAETAVPGARIAYARNAFSEYATAEDVLANLDEATRRRNLVRRFLAESLAQCEPEVWSARFDLRDSLATTDRDPFTQVAIMQAYYRAELARGEEAAHLQHVHDTLDAAVRELDAPARQRALHQGDAEYARCAAASAQGSS